MLHYSVNNMVISAISAPRIQGNKIDITVISTWTFPSECSAGVLANLMHLFLTLSLLLKYTGITEDTIKDLCAI